jgi:hypothetical protein
MLAAALPVIGATLGGIQGYQQSGGDIGAAALGAGIGAAGGRYLPMLGPSVTRMAGQALGPLQGSSLAAVNALGRIPGLGKALEGMNLAQKAALGAKITRGAGLAAAGAGTAAGIAGTLALPGLAGGTANLLSAPVRAATGGIAQVGQTGLGAALANQRYAANFGANLPPGVPAGIDQYGNITPAGLPAEVLGLPGLGRTLESQREGRAVAENLQRYGDINLAFREAAARKDFERQAAMKGIGQNIATNASMIQNAQIAAQNLGQTFGQGVTNALGTVYQYQ